MDRLRRLIQLIQLLQTEDHPNAAQLGQAPGASRRTVFRDLDALAHAGVEVHYDPRRRGYRLASNPLPVCRPAPTLNDRQLRGLLMLAQTLEVLIVRGTPWAADAQAALHHLFDGTDLMTAGNDAVTPPPPLRFTGS